MMNQWARNFNSNQPLTLDQIAKLAPSALATEAHSSRSDRFVYIPTIDVIKAMMAKGFQPFKATQSMTRTDDKRNFTKHMIRFRHADLMRPEVNDSVPEIVLINAHDGTSRYKLMGGIFRLVCENGMVVAESLIGSVNVMHSGNILDNVIEGSFRVIEDSQKALVATREWSGLMLTDGEQNAFAHAAHTLRFADNEGNVSTPFTPEQLLAPRRSADYNNDLYTVFNRVQENAVKGGLLARTQARMEEGTFHPSRRVRTREIKGIDQDVKLNRALWTLAEEMAKLKQAA
jgi:hypothetical protein